MRLTLAQINPVVGDIDGNVSRVLDTVRTAAGDNADLVIFPELVITGYPPKDLLERPGFIARAEAGLENVVSASTDFPGLGILLGCPARTGLSEGKSLYNSAFLIEGGQIVFQQSKLLLPTYDVFDEARHFLPVKDNVVFPFKKHKLGISICEDLWHDPDPWNQQPYSCDPIDMLAEKGASILINISASPFSVGKQKVRFDLIHKHTKRHGVPFVFLNQVGGNDDLVFDGHSLVVGAGGDVQVALPSFEESVETIDLENMTAIEYHPDPDNTSVWNALVTGTRDYARKCGFSKVIVGLSGGIDSAVTTVVAAEALGAGSVRTVAMPSPFSSPASLEDARQLARNLGVEFDVIEISPIMESYRAALEDAFQNTPRGVAEENIQARIRGNIIMALSNKFGYLPLSTGNKSELAVGYCTLYGDMSGGLAVISDVPKTLVYELAAEVNSLRQVIPARIIEKAPSAELKPNQTDQDTLPPYPVLDQILQYYVDRMWSVDKIVEAGFERGTVEWVAHAVRSNEYKRKQAAPGIKITSKAFGSGRRIPIAAKYKD